MRKPYQTIRSHLKKEAAPDEKGASVLLNAELVARAKSLEMLYDYTKFHIGVYLTLTGSYITIASIKVGEGTNKAIQFLPTNPRLMVVAVALFLLAGVAAGIIVISITQFVGGSSTDFLKTQIGPWNAQRFHCRGTTWTYIEHTSFWIGLLFAVASVFVPREWPSHSHDVPAPHTIDPAHHVLKKGPIPPTTSPSTIPPLTALARSGDESSSTSML
jgi:hypothetical protein